MQWLRYEAGEGETITDRPGRRVQIKLGLPELAMTESRYGKDESGPAAHVHRHHEDCFWVLEGELTFEIGAERRQMRAGPGDFMLVPRGVVHTFRNESRGDARFLNFHAPDAGFVSQLRARSSARDEDDRRSAAEEFDTFDPSPDGGRPASDVLVRRAREGERLQMRTSSAVIKAGLDGGEGSIAILETMLEPAFGGPGAHRHLRTIDSFFVLEGVLSLTIDGRSTEIAAGGYAAVPPGTVHTFTNLRDEPTRFLNIMAPAGLEGYLRELAAGAGTGASETERAAGMVARYDFQPVE